MLPHLWIEEIRDPLFTISIDDATEYDDTGTTTTRTITYGFYMLSITFWLELLFLIICQTMLAVITSIIIYKYIIKNSNYNTISTYLLGYGFILPFWIFIPTYLLNYFNIQNFIIRFCIGVITPTLSLFRTMEAMYGFVPKYAINNKSMKEYGLYFASPLFMAHTDGTNSSSSSSSSTKKKEDRDDQEEDDDDTMMMMKKQQQKQKQQYLIPVTNSELIIANIKFFIYMFITGFYQSWLTLYPEYCVFATTTTKTKSTTVEEWYSLNEILSIQRWGSSLFQAVLFQLYLSTFSEGLIFFFSLLLGYRIIPVMDNPVFKSKSPSEFWGKRWNMIIHKSIKQGIFKPIFLKFTNKNKSLAVFGTFLVSGLFHEWLLTSVFITSTSTSTSSNNNIIDPSSSSSSYSPVYGGASIFFIWQTMLIIAEVQYKKYIPLSIQEKLYTNLPQPIITICIIVLGLPLAHWFTEPYVRSNFFIHGQMALPMILRID